MIMPVTTERKFTASRHRFEEALCILRQFTVPDPRFPAGSIRSIYLDSPRLRALDEKANGDFLKTKVRLRWYGGEGEAADAFLEIKHRLGGGRKKERLRMKLARNWLETIALDDPELRPGILGPAGGLGAQVPADYIPMLGLRYDRFRFVCALTGARVCLDANVRVDRVNARHLPAAACPALPDIVFEFKDVARVEIPWLGELAHAGFMPHSFSKYGECIRRALEGGAPA